VALNRQTIEALREFQTEGEPDFVTELVDAYIGDSPMRLQAMRDAMASQDESSFGKAAHGLKGSSGNLGAEKLAALCLQGEQFAKAGNMAGAQGIFSQIESEFLTVCAELKALRKP
jgi:HPt (histidine-containing phosphotransfer) domain-containing protein